MSQKSNDNDPYSSTNSKENQNISSNAPLDLLSEKFKQLETKAPQSKEQFYRSSFEIFSALNDLVRSQESQYLGNLENSDIINTITEYIDLTHDYKDASHLQPIWEICNILYFSKGNGIATELSSWLNEHYPIPSLEEQRANDPDEDYEEHSLIGPTWIWEDARRQLLRANLDEAIDVLSFSLSFVSPNEALAINSMIQLIQEFQEIRDQEEDDITTYKEKWTVWHEKCIASALDYKNLSERTDYADEKGDEIVFLFGVLTGQERHLFKCGTFIENIVGTILFSRPQITTAGVNQLAQHMDSDGIEQDTILRACQLFLMGYFDDAFDACGNDTWLQTHLGYALISVGALNNDFHRLTKSANNEQVLDPIYYGIQQYASDIAEEFDMWDEAVIYLSSCSTNSEIWIKDLLGEPPLPNKELEQLQSILDIAIKYELLQVQTFIHKSMGHRYEQKHDIRQATIEFGKAGDVNSLDRLAHREFTEYARTGKLDNVVTDMKELFACPHYTILIHYTQFHENLKQKKWKEASANVMALIKNEKLPNRFEIVLLIDNLEILKETQHYYAPEQLIELIRIFKQVTNKDTSDQTFMSKYYKLVTKTELNPDIITAKIRESLAYKAATAQSTV